VKCRICDKDFVKEKYGGEYKDICSSECFNDAFWLEKIKDKDIITIIDGESYYIDDEKSNSSFRGFSGQKFIIKYIDGDKKDKVIVTTNLWYNGVIPEKFRDKLKNNAIFCKSRIDEFAESLLI